MSRLMRILGLIQADYRAHYAYKGESDKRLTYLMLPRLLTNASMHAIMLVRLQTGLPHWTAWVWRRLLISHHSIDIASDILIGPGFQLPHPFGVAIGARSQVGSNVVLHHNVTFGPTRGRDFQSAGNIDVLVVEDDVVFFPGSTALGPIRIGRGAMIGVAQVLVEDLPAGSTYFMGKIRPPRADPN